MKILKPVIFLFVIVLLSSCKLNVYYQIYSVAPTKSISQQDNLLVYEDDNCKVMYNFWSENGDAGFTFYNKKDDNIYINMEESFFIFNGIAHNYYQRRTYTTSQSLGVSNKGKASATQSILGLLTGGSIGTSGIAVSNSVGVSQTTGTSISYEEEKIICVPAKTSKIIKEYDIKAALYRDCNLFRFPNRRQLNSVKFTRDDSPYVFSNKIAYYIPGQEGLFEINNEFYINTISNFREDEVTELRNDGFCGNKSAVKNRQFRSISPDQFYIIYTKDSDNNPH